jgi:hypothetical protein
MHVIKKWMKNYSNCYKAKAAYYVHAKKWMKNYPKPR